MHARVGGNDNGVVEIGRAQIMVFGIAEGKIDQAIVDEIDRLALRQQSTTLMPKLTAIHNHRVDAIPLQEMPSQQKFRIKILFRGPIIDDCDPPRNALPFLEFPLVLEHGHDRRFEIVSPWRTQRDFDFRATGSLSPGQQRIQESTAGVGIYLDQLGALGGKVEVIAHEYANRPEIVSGDLGSPGQDRVPIAGQSGRGLDCMNDTKHRGDVGF